MPDRRDRYYYLAKKDNYRSRAAFKLMELQTKYNLFHQGQHILEVGASPGGWTQIITSITGSTVIAVDISQMNPMDNVVFIRGRIEDPRTAEAIRKVMLEREIVSLQGVASDAMAHTSGKHDIDHASSYLICDNVMKAGTPLLDEGGFVILKQFYGDLTTQFINRWKNRFGSVHTTRVAASRDASSEVYIVFTGYRPPASA